MLALDYPKLEVIAINDRSTDTTGQILDNMAIENSRLKVYHLTELPANWLGKNHALWYGATRAEGELTRLPRTTNPRTTCSQVV